MTTYPNRLRGGASDEPAFIRRPDYYFVRDTATRAPAGAVAIMRDSAAHNLVVFRGHPSRKVEADAGPVYSAGPDGPLAVPTGRVFIRLADGVRPADRRAALAAAGFEIERTVPYAPGAAWLRPASGGLAHALSALDALAAVPDMVHVEPQMLMERASRGR